jgi:hypothetical protein
VGPLKRVELTNQDATCVIELKRNLNFKFKTFIVTFFKEEFFGIKVEVQDGYQTKITDLKIKIKMTNKCQNW